MTVYPVISGGSQLTAALLTSMQEVFVVKAGDTPRASTTVLANDPDLSLPVPANSKWWVEMFIAASAVSAADIKTAWSVPAGATGNRRISGPGSTSNDALSDNVTSRWGVHGFTSAMVYGARSGGNQFQFQEICMVTVAGTAGNIVLQWAQQVSDATATTVYADSYIRARRVA